MSAGYEDKRCPCEQQPNGLAEESLRTESGQGCTELSEVHREFGRKNRICVHVLRGEERVPEPQH